MTDPREVLERIESVLANVSLNGFQARELRQHLADLRSLLDQPPVSNEAIAKMLEDAFDDQEVGDSAHSIALRVAVNVRDRTRLLPTPDQSPLSDAEIQKLAESVWHAPAGYTTDLQKLVEFGYNIRNRCQFQPRTITPELERELEAVFDMAEARAIRDTTSSFGLSANQVRAIRDRVLYVPMLRAVSPELERVLGEIEERARMLAKSQRCLFLHAMVCERCGAPAKYTTSTSDGCRFACGDHTNVASVPVNHDFVRQNAQTWQELFSRTDIPKLLAIIRGKAPVPAPVIREYQFDRYRDGRKKAEGATVHAFNEVEALSKAKGLFHDCPGDTFVLCTQPANTPLETQIVGLHAKVFPNYAYTDSQTAIDLMSAEILTARVENTALETAACEVADWLEAVSSRPIKVNHWRAIRARAAKIRAALKDKA